MARVLHRHPDQLQPLTDVRVLAPAFREPLELAALLAGA
jgi:hypothetical protein